MNPGQRPIFQRSSYAMDTGPRGPMAPSEPRQTSGRATSTRQITRNRASYSCHACRRRKIKCDKVGAVATAMSRPLTGCRFTQFAAIAPKLATNAHMTRQRRPRQNPTPFARIRWKNRVLESRDVGPTRSRAMALHLRRARGDPTTMRTNPQSQTLSSLDWIGSLRWSRS